jgi:hypothetical protein
VQLPGTASSYTRSVMQPGNEGNTYRFRVAAQNELGTGVYSDEIRLVATDAPDTPGLSLLESSRTLTSVELSFGRPASSGGSSITGYTLYQDEGIASSPFHLIFNGTTRPEIVSFNVSGLQTALTYSFRLYAQNQIFASNLPATLQVLIGTLPDRPRRIRRVDAPFADGKMTVEWDRPDDTGGVDLTSYELFFDDGSGDFASVGA